MRAQPFFPTVAACIACISLSFAATSAQPGGERKPPRLKVSDNHRFLATEQNKPFIYLADTAWELFHRIKREDVDFYLETRARQGFTVIQAVALDVEAR